MKFIKGELEQAGGKKTINLHVIVDDLEIIIDCKKENAKKANHFLYSEVMMAVWETKCGDRVTHQYGDVYNSLETYDFFKNTFERITSDSYSKVQALKDIHIFCRDMVLEGDFGNLRKFLRLFKHDSVDVNILKTILVILFPVKENENINELYSEIDTIFENKVEKLRALNIQNLN